MRCGSQAVGNPRRPASRLGRRNRAALCGRRAGSDRRPSSRLRADPKHGRGIGDRWPPRGRRRASSKALGCPFVELSTVSTVHCEIGRTVETEYHALHDLATTAPDRNRFLQRCVGTPLPARPPIRGRRDHGPGDRDRRLSRAHRTCLSRRNSLLSGSGPRIVVHQADRSNSRADDRMSPFRPAGRIAIRWPRSWKCSPA